MYVQALDPVVLCELPLFRGLSPAEMLPFVSLLRPSVAPAGTALMTAEQPGELVCLILTGTVKVHVIQADGRDVILAIRGPGELVGEMSFLERSPRSATVVTLEETNLCWIHHTAFAALLDQSSRIACNLARILSRRLRWADQHIQALSTLDVFGRVARQLLAFAQEYGTSLPDGKVLIPMRLTQGDLASLVGASRERVNQVLGEYRRQGYLTISPDCRITLHKPDALLQRCQ